VVRARTGARPGSPPPTAPAEAPPGRRGQHPYRVLRAGRRGTVTTVTSACVLFAISSTLIPMPAAHHSTKTQANIFESFGFWFASPFCSPELPPCCSRTWMRLRDLLPSGFGPTRCVRGGRRGGHRAWRVAGLLRRLRPVPLPGSPRRFLPGDRALLVPSRLHAAAVPGLTPRCNRITSDLGHDPPIMVMPGVVGVYSDAGCSSRCRCRRVSIDAGPASTGRRAADLSSAGLPRWLPGLMTVLLLKRCPV